jgi:uncharacterized protein (UPF0261 family)
VALLGTLDTKGAEYQWVSDALERLGVEVHVIDTGVRAPTGFSGVLGVDQDAVARAAGTTVAALAEQNDRGAAITAMSAGAASVLQDLVAAGEIHAAFALGGSGGSAMFARAVRELPIGFPKLLVSTMASGDVSAYIGASDVTLMYSVVDVAGINRISRSVLGNAAAAAAAMAAACRARGAAPENEDERPLVAASMFGVTTSAVDTARERLTELGYEVLVFHATGSGGRAIESLARSDMLAGVLDLTTTELADDLVGGVLSAGPDRLTAAGASAVPQVVSVGALDMVNFGPENTVPAAFADRQFFVHNPTVTLMRTTPDENAELGRRVGAKLAGASGRTVLMIPRAGISALDADGMPFRDEKADDALFDELLAALDGSGVQVVDRPEHINDNAFAIRAADELHRLITTSGPA